MKKDKLKTTPHLGFINFALGFAGRAQLAKVNKAAKNCRKATAKTLRSILEYASGTEWGRAHNFSEILKARTDEELFTLYQKNQGITDYEDIRPFVERHKNGEENILFPGKPKMYATTSGTTGKPKWIPITNEYYDNVYNKMTKLWLYTFLMHRPRCFSGKTVSIVGKAIEGYAPDGTVFGSVSGVTRRDIPDFIKPIHSAPAEVFEIADYTARYYTIMRISIEQNVSIIITANPSTIVEMQNNVNEFFEDYVTDIEKGTLNKNLKIEPKLRAVLESYFKPNPARAEQLRKLKAEHPVILPKHYWPNFQILTTWKCGNTKIYMEKFKESFPENMLYQEFSYFSSECRSGLVLNGKDDTVLFPHMHYFEFVAKEDLESENPKYLQIYELEKGREYSVYVTTWSGLYRYPMNDLVKVTGFYKTIPTIQFIQKINGIISMTGEKLSETQFIQAVKIAEEKTGLPVQFFVGFADVQNSLYNFYFEFKDSNVTQEQTELFGQNVDSALKELNIEYEAKRASFRVKEPVSFQLEKSSFETYKERCIAAGKGRDGQFKLNLLMQDEERHNMFHSLIKK
ncbi:GH3 auxin-responsive promoter family protein [Treponema berlinense]|uniref:GH3 auxin-responsive promoter family protein n=1 Tax=Treponema berlinense TaxID=225004 RepID=UPI0026ED79C6|nr:GH3 auxin-responsive promoter family protein [Treponema berlinense]